MSSVGSPTTTVRVMSVVPSGYWPPLSMRNSSPGLTRRLVCVADAIMHDGAIGPEPEIVGKLTSRSMLVSRRNSSSFCTAVISSSVPSDAQSSSHARKRTTAWPSRTCAARAPMTSASDLMAFGTMQGSWPREISLRAELLFEPIGGSLGIETHALALGFQLFHAIWQHCRRKKSWRQA